MAACTCRAWRAAAGDPRVWREACVRDGVALHEARPPQTSEREHWRGEYERRQRARRNWGDGRVAQRDCKGGGALVVMLATGRTAGRTLVTAGMFDGSLKTWWGQQ